MAAAPVAPDQNDLSGLAWIVEWFRNWAGAIFGSGALGAVYLAGRKVQSVDGTQTEHQGKIAKLEASFEALKVQVAALNVQVAALPTRDDLREQSTLFNSQIQGAVSQIGQMVATMAHPRH